MPKIHALCAREFNDRCALAGRHGRAQRRRPYQTPSYFSTQAHTNKITIYAQSTPTKPTAHVQSTQTTLTIPHPICPNETVGAVPVCPPEHPRSGVSIPKTHALCAGNLTTDVPLWGDTGGHIGTAPTHLHHIFPHNPTQTKEPFTCNPPKRNQLSTHNLPKRHQPFHAQSIQTKP